MPWLHPTLTLAAVLLAAPPVLSNPPPAFHADAKDPRQLILGALGDELDRSLKELKLRDHEAPYFVAGAVRGVDSEELAAKYGAIFVDGEKRERHLSVDVRVGSYELDNTGNAEMFDFDAADSGYAAGREAPLDQLEGGRAPLGDPALALRNSVWLLADESYKHALAAYLKKKGKEIYRPDDPQRPPSLSREPAVVHIAPPLAAPFDRALWRNELARESARLAKRVELFDSNLRAGVDRQERLIANTEGTRIVSEQAIYSLHAMAWARAPDGMLLEDSRDWYGFTEAELPRGERLARELDQLADELAALQKAPAIDPYTGPALLAPEASGVLFHEALGHRLEGERQNDDHDGHTFKGQINHPILPTFLSVFDDPTRSVLAPPAAAPGREAKPTQPQPPNQIISLNGFYDYDDQGVPAQKTTLVKEGVLQSYLLSRAPVEGFTRSNGHGRSAPGRDPVARMSNLIVESTRTLSWAELKAALIAEARKQGRPYGLIIRDVSGGNTDTSSYAYQAFKGQPRLVYRVDANTGAEEIVRGVEIVGTPLSSINKILATGDDPRVFDGYCGAESGFVPVSTVAPTILIGELELQRTRKDTGRPPILSSPAIKP